MPEREIASIVWHERGEQVDLIYVEGEADRLVGSRAVVTELALSVGLTTVPAPTGMIRWVRSPEEEPA
jgi:hypothetical protein